MAFSEKLKSWLEAVKQWPGRLRQYFADVGSELKKVSWPTRQEVYGTTVVVLVTVFVFGFYLWIVDILLEYGVSNLFRYFGAGS